VRTVLGSFFGTRLSVAGSNFGEQLWGFWGATMGSNFAALQAALTNGF